MQSPSMAQQYSLRWNNHQPNFISMFTSLLNTQTLVDVTLAAEGKHMKAHRVVLSACSSYFQSLFVDNPSQHPIVILKDVSFADLQTMVDFMYYGEVNVTEQQLPKVLDTAKMLKIKGLTEMPESSSLTRAPVAAGGFQAGSQDSQRHSPANLPSSKRRRRRVSSTGSTQTNVESDARQEDQALELVPGEESSITMNDAAMGPATLHRRPRLHQDDRSIDSSQQTTESHGMNVEHLSMDNPSGMSQESSSSQAGLKMRRSKYFKRQSRVQPDEREVRKQSSEPAPAPPAPAPPLQKHQSYPQYRHRRSQTHDHEVGSLLIRAVTVIGRQSSASASTSVESILPDTPPNTHRASHTPAVRSGPPLSCNFCWNTVDESGRILRRKTQYHCPECRTNLCIVPCFHEYHDGPEGDANATSAR